MSPAMVTNHVRSLEERLGARLLNRTTRKLSLTEAGKSYFDQCALILAQIEAHAVGNIRLFAGDAAELLAWAPPRSLARIDLIHPDPWPKRRHWKRRFVQDATVSAMARVLRPGGEFRFVTDIADYAAWTLKHLIRSPDFAWTAERAHDWRHAWPGFSATRYEAKARREGRVPCYLIFRRTDDGRRTVG